MTGTRRILTIVHQADSTPGRVGDLLLARGYELDQRCPMLGDTLPDRLDGHAAAIVFGGPQSANDDSLAGMRTELDWLERTALPSGRPLLGICLGAQQIARVLGARVGPHDDGVVEIGYTHIAPTEAGRGFLPEPAWFYQWHSETFAIPHGAVHLAASEAFPHQAYRYDGHVYGLEFHPEMTREMIERWCQSESGSRKLGLPGAQPPAAQLADFDRHAADSDRWLGEFLDRQFLVSSVRDA